MCDGGPSRLFEQWRRHCGALLVQMNVCRRNLRHISCKNPKVSVVDPIALNWAGSGSRMLAQFGIGFRVMLSVWRRKNYHTLNSFWRKQFNFYFVSFWVQLGSWSDLDKCCTRIWTGINVIRICISQRTWGREDVDCRCVGTEPTFLVF